MCRAVAESSKNPHVDGWTPHFSPGHANPEQVHWCWEILTIPLPFALIWIGSPALRRG